MNFSLSTFMLAALAAITLTGTPPPRPPTAERSSDAARPPGWPATEPGLAPAKGVYRFPSGEAAARLTTLDLPPRPIDVWFPAEADLEHSRNLLYRLRGYLAQLPTTHVAALHTIAFDPTEYPHNNRKAKLLGQPELKLWASARQGVMTFYRNDPPGDWRVSRRRVFHELGHCLAHVRFGSSTPPPSWEEAVKADNTFFSDYSRNAYKSTGTLIEDFADAYAAYMQGLVDGDQAMTEFRTGFPARAKLIAILAAD